MPCSIMAVAGPAVHTRIMAADGAVCSPGCKHGCAEGQDGIDIAPMAAVGPHSLLVQVNQAYLHARKEVRHEEGEGSRARVQECV